MVKLRMCEYFVTSCYIIIAIQLSCSPIAALDQHRKRHSDVEHEESVVFLEKIFSKYGENGLMTFEGFEHLLASLGIGNIDIQDHDIHDHYLKGSFSDMHNNHNHTETLNTINETESNNNVSNNQQMDHPSSGGRNRRSIQSDNLHSKSNPPLEKPVCLAPADILSTFRLQFNRPITEDNFLHLCPAIIYQIDKHSCSSGPCDDIHDHIDDHLQGYHDLHNHNQSDVISKKIDFWNIPGKTWGFAILAVSIISLVGLLCVAIIPVMQRLFFNHLIQFLVALAVGSLTGDAMLHLIPHAMITHDSSSHNGETPDHSAGVYKGLAVLIGLYLFFLAERGLAYLSQWRQNRVSKKKLTSHVTEPEDFPVRFKRYSQIEDTIGEKLSCHNRLSVCDFAKMAEDHESYDINRYEELQQLKPCDQNTANNFTDTENTYSEEVEFHDDHGKGHGHSHEVPQSVSSIAWMVIMGDGLHNFCDGLAIGASFASSITGGLSTSVAVFCHELPHELGDFAVLLKAGMSAKQALFYNLISSVLCFIGLVIGILAGNLTNVDTWIFCLVGGMFIYISLVDMLPEITSSSGGQHQCCYLLLQCLGISTGVVIMMIIALYEEQISLGLGDNAL